jgi:hypothetical protein
LRPGWIETTAGFWVRLRIIDSTHLVRVSRAFICECRVSRVFWCRDYPLGVLIWCARRTPSYFRHLALLAIKGIKIRVVGLFRVGQLV